MRAVELRPVAALDRELIGARGERLALVLDRLVEDDRLGAIERVIGDGRHLVHVLGLRVDERVVRIELGLVDREAPVVGEQGHDRRGSGDFAAIDERAFVVVAQLDGLRGTERLQGVRASFFTCSHRPHEDGPATMRPIRRP
jgi:hypothetical protein